MPILFNEVVHFNFDQPVNNFVEAVKIFSSWGYFNYRMKDEGFDDDYQSVPVSWGISSPRKKAFFNKLEGITGGRVGRRKRIDNLSKQLFRVCSTPEACIEQGGFHCIG